MPESGTGARNPARAFVIIAIECAREPGTLHVFRRRRFPCCPISPTRDVETLIHPYTQLAAFRETGPLILERGEGVWVYDIRGQALSRGPWPGCGAPRSAISNRELAEAAYEQMLKLPFQHLFSGRSHDPAIELAEKLKEIAPVPGLEGVLHLVRLGGQ